MSDYLRLAMIMPFILNSFLESSSLKENESRSILRRIQESRINMAKNVIIACWVYVAKTMRIVFESKFTLDSYDELQKCFEEEMKILPKNVELDLLKRYTTLFAIHHLVDGGADQRLSQPCRGFATMSSNFRNLLNEQKLEGNDISTIINLLLSFMDIGQKSALIYSQMSWYELATYTMEESDGVFSKVHLHIGDVVTIHEEDSGECYAIIKGIFKYKGNDDKYYAFITIDWFDKFNRIHNVLKCPLFCIQTSH
ncbi:hypothetical protein RhiirA5_428740 [Rhizophagus irregularis]|uniref:BAH domain-containing protein n=1 Tax=Rhizophagus irregularis TaxID=588596 RepID=A0A2N0NZV5_9GLOM|nr:hypothetical protein RhiirA5_428740 [Rhizophagus irregularis]